MGGLIQAVIRFMNMTRNFVRINEIALTRRYIFVAWRKRGIIRKTSLLIFDVWFLLRNLTTMNESRILIFYIRRRLPLCQYIFIETYIFILIWSIGIILYAGFFVRKQIFV